MTLTDAGRAADAEDRGRGPRPPLPPMAASGGGSEQHPVQAAFESGLWAWWALVCAFVLIAGCRSSSGALEPGSGDGGEASQPGPDAQLHHAPDGGTTRCVSGGEGFPRRLLLPHQVSNGAYDPSLERDPISGRLWLAYSTVEGPAGEGKVSTHLAYSDNEGLTFCDAGVINRSRSVEREQWPPGTTGVSAHWSHEVPELVHDPGAEVSARWRLIWHRYLHVDDGVSGTDDRRFAHGWIAVRRAPAPEALGQAMERKLFSSRAYHLDPAVEAYNDRAPGGRPEVRFDDRPLSACLALTEPGGVAAGGVLYLALTCVRSPADRSVELLALDRARATWVYRGRALAADEMVGEVMGTHRGFSGADIVRDRSGSMRLLATPVRPAGGYLGCVAFALDLTTAGATSPVVVAPGPSDPEIFQSGPCTASAGSRLGVLTGDVFIRGVQFQIVATGQPLF